jgi:hypothetical protein
MLLPFLPFLLWDLGTNAASQGVPCGAILTRV